MVIGKCNVRLDPKMKRPKEITYQVTLDSLALSTCYHAFTITVDVPEVYMHQFWNTIYKHRSEYRFKIDDKKFAVNVEEFRRILNFCPIVEGQEFDEVPYESEALEFVRSLVILVKSSTSPILLLIIFINHGELLLPSSTDVFLGRYMV